MIAESISQSGLQGFVALFYTYPDYTPIKVNDANIAAPLIENPLPEETLSNEIAATAKLKSTKKKSKKSDANRRFTADQAAKYYSEQSGKPLSASSLRANATKYGFKVWERGSGLYILIDS